jgi:hypothetical protein
MMKNEQERKLYLETLALALMYVAFLMSYIALGF